MTFKLLGEIRGVYIIGTDDRSNNQFYQNYTMILQNGLSNHRFLVNIDLSIKNLISGNIIWKDEKLNSST